jgi:hypothetical protein
MPAREYFRSWTFSIERWAFSFEIGRTHGTPSRISRQSHSRGEWIQIPRGCSASTADEAVTAAKEFGGEVVMCARNHQLRA